LNEFELIRRFFASQGASRDDVVLGIGDDAAVLTPPPGKQLVVTTDTLVEGVHFFPGADPADVGHKALAVNLSDLAAMSAEPAWFLLNIVLPAIDEAWLHEFCRGLFALADTNKIQLVGGNTSHGPLVISIEAHGFVPEGEAVRRSGAEPGDSLYVTGELGDAALALQHRLGRHRLSSEAFEAVRGRSDRPTPRVREGMLLRRFASSAVDVSDGLVADVGHLLEASGVGALIVRERVPISDTYRAQLPDVGWDLALTGGEDYELCFTVPARHDAEFARWQSKFGCRATCIGEIVSGPGLQVLDTQGNPYQPRVSSYDHFASAKS
jgi:thiamine-monophosphate kinase